MKKIEDIKEGDLVWSYNELERKQELKKVVALSVNESSQIIVIKMGSVKIESTPEHPFYIDGEWIEAKNLKVGDKLYGKEGFLLKITSITNENRNEKVYNFEVEENHNYYVSDKEVLVHNDCGTGWIKKSLFSKLMRTDKALLGEFLEAMEKGPVSNLKGAEGIKALQGKGIKGHMWELKITGKNGKYRLLGDYEEVVVGSGKNARTIKTVVFKELYVKPK